MLSMKQIFIHRIHDELNNGKFGSALCTVSPVHSQITSLGLLSLFLETKKERGLYVSILRPYQYLARLLRKASIPDEGLTFLDAISPSDASNEGKETVDHASIVRLPERIEEALDNIPEAGFLILDNISGLIPHISVQTLITLLEDIRDGTRARADFQLIFIIDHDMDPTVTKALDSMCEHRLDITPGLFR